MKKQIPGFLSGMLTMALIGSLSIGALAATGRMTIEVDPINIQVNGETFQPKDAHGNDVPVFAYNGTTYAPLRALAEAYGLTVGYDQEANMATVGEVAPADTPAPVTVSDYSDWTAEEEAAYQEFKGWWVRDNENSDKILYKYTGTLELDELKECFKEHPHTYWYNFLMRFAEESGGSVILEAADDMLFAASNTQIIYDVVFGVGYQYSGEPRQKQP